MCVQALHLMSHATWQRFVFRDFRVKPSLLALGLFIFMAATVSIAVRWPQKFKTHRSYPFHKVALDFFLVQSTATNQNGEVFRHQEGIGHYTQLVWRATERLGCSLSQQNRVAVCQYFPPGNQQGQYRRQVTPPVPGFSGLSGEEKCGGPIDMR